MTKSRLEAFSDGVIAIIITIMVLELRPPEKSGWSDLQKLWPFFLSYLISFTNMGIYWANHHHLLQTVKEVRGGMLWANLHLLFWLSLMPFATAWMAENNFEQNTVAVYAFLGMLCGLAYYILLIIIKKCNPGNDILQNVWKKQTRKGMLSLFLYAAAVATAFLKPLIAGILIIAVAIMWLIPDRNIEKAITEE